METEKLEMVTVEEEEVRNHVGSILRLLQENGLSAAQAVIILETAKRYLVDTFSIQIIELVEMKKEEMN